VTLVHHDDARYAAALARVDACIADLEAKCQRGRQLVAESELARCPECGERFRPNVGQRFLCADPGCLRARKTRLQRLYRARERRRAPVALTARRSCCPSPLDAIGARCRCGGDLEFVICMEGNTLERCRSPGCREGGWKLTSRRRAA
jgi:hypothetical protein